MSLDNTANNVNKIPFAAAHTAGSGTLVLATAGTQFPSAPFRITAILGPTYQTSDESLTIFGVSAVATNTPTSGQCTLTATAIEGTTDQNYAENTDFAELRLTAGTISDLNAQVATNTASIATLQSDTITITAGSGLTGGGAVALGGSVSLAATAGGGGSVTNVSVVTANGFEATVANPGTTPAITLQTTAAGVLKGSANAIVAATAGTDYVVPSGNITGTAGGLSSTLAVGSGGTGEATLTSHAVLIGNGTSAVAFAAAGTAGRVLIDQGASANPAFETVSGDATMASSGALTVASIGGKAVTLGGTLTTSGAFNTTITTTGATSVTLPTSGTLVNSAVTTLSSLVIAESQVTGLVSALSTIAGEISAINADTITITAGTGLTGGGTISLGGSVSLAVAGGGSVPNVQAFTSSGTYTVPTGATTIRIVGIGVGGSGGGGGVGTTSIFGGSSGGSGSAFEVTYRAVDLPSSLTVTIASAPAGGAGAAITGGTGGAVGTSNSPVTNGGTTYAIALGGGRGNGGGTSAPAVSPAITGWIPSQPGLASSITTAGIGGQNTVGQNGLIGGQGGAGSGITSGGAASGGGGSGGSPIVSTPPGGAGGTAPGGAGSNGGPLWGGGITDLPAGGTGGGGGAANPTGPGGTGGNGGSYGAGGGGGGASVTGQGAGGNGGSGGPSIICFYAW
jgi:hypothetical protein